MFLFILSSYDFLDEMTWNHLKDGRICWRMLDRNQVDWPWQQISSVWRCGRIRKVMKHSKKKGNLRESTVGNWFEKYDVKMTLESKHGFQKFNESQLPLVPFSVIAFHMLFIGLFSFCFGWVVLSPVHGSRGQGTNHATATEPYR